MIESCRMHSFFNQNLKARNVSHCKIGVRASNKKPDVDIGDKARSIKSKFENGEVYEEKQNHSQQIDDSAVFEHGE